MQTQKSGHVFVSYAREDSEFALRLVRDLKAAGLPVWVDKHDLIAGVLWDDVILEALNEAQTVVVVLSPHSARSPHVPNEIAVAQDAGKRIVPVMLRETPVPLGLARIQRCDFTRGYDESLPGLIAALRSDNAGCAAPPNKPDVLVDAQSKYARNSQSLAVPATALSLFAPATKHMRSLGLVVAMAAVAIAGILWVPRLQNRSTVPTNPPLARVPSAVPFPSPKNEGVDLAQLAARDLLAGDWVSAVMPVQKSFLKREGGLLGGDKFDRYKTIQREALGGLDAAHQGFEAEVRDDAKHCGKDKYLCQIYVTTTAGIDRDEILVVSFAARCITGKCKTEFGFDSFDPEMLKVSGTMIPGLLGEVEVGRQWTHCKIHFRAPESYAKGAAAAMIRLGLATQTLQIASLALKAYGVHHGALPASECLQLRSNQSGK